MPDEAKIILAATHGKLTKVRDCLLIEDSINSIQCQFEFRTSDWDNTSKTAVFVRGWATPSTPSADMIVVMLDENNECTVPHEVLNKGIAFSVGVFGSSDGYRIVSNWMYYKIKDGCFAEGSSPIDPSSTVYEQILEALKNKSNIDHNHDERYYTKEKSDELLDNIKSAYTDAIIEEKNRAEGIESGLRGDIDRVKSDYLKSTDKEEIYNNINNKVNRNELDAYAKKSDVEELIPDNIVTKRVTFSTSDGSNYVADTTYDEIANALNNGQFVYGYFNGTVAPYSNPYIVDGILSYRFVVNDIENGVSYSLFINPDNTTIFDMDNIIAPNPNPLVFTGATSVIYDGSAPIRVNIPKTATDDDIIDLLTELGEITPVAASDGSIYTDNQNRIILI